MPRIHIALAAAALTASAAVSGCASTRGAIFGSPQHPEAKRRCGVCRHWDASHKGHPLRANLELPPGGGLDDREHALLLAYDDAARAACETASRLCDSIPATERAAMDARFVQLARYYEARLVADIEAQSFAALLVRCQDYLPRCRAQLAMRQGEAPGEEERRRLGRLLKQVSYGVQHILTPDTDRIVTLVHNDDSFGRAVRALNAAHAASSPTLEGTSPVSTSLQRWRRRLQLKSLEAEVAGSTQGELAELRASVESARRARLEAEESSAASMDHALDAGVSAGNAQQSAEEAARARDAAREWTPPTAGPPPAEPSAPEPAPPPRKRTVR